MAEPVWLDHLTYLVGLRSLCSNCRTEFGLSNASPTVYSTCHYCDSDVAQQIIPEIRAKALDRAVSLQAKTERIALGELHKSLRKQLTEATSAGNDALRAKLMGQLDELKQGRIPQELAHVKR